MVSQASNTPENDLGFLLSRIGTATRLRLAEAVSPLDLTLRQFFLLSTVAAGEGLSQAQLSERLRIDPSSLVQVLDDCQNASLLERRPSASDRRRYAVHLTENGRSHLAKARRAVKAVEDELFSPLESSQRSQLLDLLLILASKGPLSTPAGGPRSLARAAR